MGVPDGWEQVLMRDLEARGDVQLGRGKVISKKDIEAIPGDYPIYSSSVKNNGLFGRYGEFLFDEELISWSVDGGGNFFYRPKHRFSVTNVSGFMRVLSPEIQCRFLHYQLDYLHGQQRYDYQHKAHPSVIRERYTVPVPPLPEQRKIAAILSSVDEAIEATQAVIDQVEVVKKGLMQELLTKGLPGRHKKFKQTEIGQIPEEWEVVELQTLCSHVVDCLHSTPTYADEGYPAIRTADVVPGRLLLNQARRVAEETYVKRIARLEPQAGDVLYSREGERYGIAAPVPAATKVCLAQRMMHFRAREGVDATFLMWLLNSPGMYRQATEDVGGSTSPHVNIKSIRRFQVPLPPEAEQTEIAAGISASVRYETRLGMNRDGLATLKRALMSVLLTGELRVQPEAAE